MRTARTCVVRGWLHVRMLRRAADGKPAAQFMYQDAGGRRLTLYVRRGLDGHHDTAFRFAEQDGVGAFYWVDGDLAYALIGDLDRPALDQAAHAVYRQLNP